MVDPDCSIFEKEKNTSVFIPCSFMMLQEENELAADRVFAVLSSSDYQIVCL